MLTNFLKNVILNVIADPSDKMQSVVHGSDVFAKDIVLNNFHLV
jgi:hypothetical protein